MDAIEAAKKLIDESISEEMKAEWTDGSIEQSLKLCINNNGFALSGDDKALFGFLRYWPAQRQAIEQMQWGDLERMDLSRGPLLHVVVFIVPEQGFKVFREIVDALNPFLVTAHRYKRGVWRFAVQKNSKWRRDGFYRRQQLQEQV